MRRNQRPYKRPKGKKALSEYDREKSELRRKYELPEIKRKLEENCEKNEFRTT